MEAEADAVLGESSCDFSIDTLLEILRNPQPPKITTTTPRQADNESIHEA